MSRTTKKTLLLASLGAALACPALSAPPADAAADQEAILQDDPEIVFADSEAELDRTLARIKGLGIDRIRVSVFWYLVAPNATSRRRPSFGEEGAASPASYPVHDWERYDRIVVLARRHDLGVLMSVTGSAPAWASGTRRRAESAFRPDPRAFGDFVQAVGTRYSGDYRQEYDGGGRPRGSPLPAVDHWSIWNEPNFPSWLQPQWQRAGRGWRPVSPRAYRRLVDAAWRGLQASGHAQDVILLGETAPYGPHDPADPGEPNALVSPLMFIRELYCLDRSFRPYRARAARARACPTTAASRRSFRRIHPALFEASGWAHHAYSLTRPPTFLGRRPDGAPLGALRRLTRTLDRAQFRWAVSSDWPVWITEYGYQTLPPDPYRGVSWRRQATWMSWAEYLVYRNPRVGSFAQFLLVDDAPRTRYGRSDPRRWVTWQSGFVTTDGETKPSYAEFRRPIHVTPRRTTRGRGVRVFGVYRPADDGSTVPARIDFRSQDGDWGPLATLTAAGRRGYLLARVRPPSSGFVRIVWTDPETGSTVRSRAVAVSVRG